MATVLVDPGQHEDNPKQILYSNLNASTCCVWYNASGSLDVVSKYALDLLSVTKETLDFGEDGFAQTKDGSLFFAGVTGPAGAAFAVFPTTNSALNILNNGITREWNAMADAIGRGQWHGLPGGTKRSLVAKGNATADMLGGDQALEIINQAEIADLSQLL